MSEAEIRELCEKYINRSFEEEDTRLLRNFLRAIEKRGQKATLSEAV